MSFDGSGNYSASVSGYPAIAGSTIQASFYNAMVSDFVSGFNNCLTRDGQGKPSGNMDWNAKNLTNINLLTAATMNLTSGNITTIAAVNLTVTGTTILGATSINSLAIGTPLGTLYGGTGVDAHLAGNGKLLIGNGAGFTLANITAGAGITITNSAGGITIAAAGLTTNGQTQFPITFNNAGTGAASGTTFDGTAARTISWNTVGALPLTPRVGSVSASAGTVAPDASSQDMIAIVGDAAIVIGAIANPIQGFGYVFRIKDNGTARTISWNAIYRGVGNTLPTTTVVSKILYVAAIYNQTDLKWDVIAVAQEA